MLRTVLIRRADDFDRGHEVGCGGFVVDYHLVDVFWTGKSVATENVC